MKEATNKTKKGSFEVYSKYRKGENMKENMIEKRRKIIRSGKSEKRKVQRKDRRTHRSEKRGNMRKGKGDKKEERSGAKEIFKE